MSPEETQFRIQFHTEQANRLLSENPLVREFQIHLNAIGELSAKAKPDTQQRQAIEISQDEAV